jgi:hypothetical protein
MDELDLLNVLPVGARLHSYEVTRVLGKGGFGITYLVRHTAFAERLAAIKEYFPEELTLRDGGTARAKSSQHQRLFESGKRRFLEEAQTLARFQHPNIVQVTDFFEANGTAYLVMVYEEGNPLSEVYRHVWRRGRGPDEAALLAMALPLLGGLAALHHGGIIHRDIKPSNIFLRRRDDSPVLLDFGAARQAMGVRTKTLTALLTPGYAPFEQYYSKSDRQGPWSDIYAMGAVLYHGVSGKPPAEATLRSDAMLRGEVDPMVSALELGQGHYSEKFLAAIDWSLALLERQRPQTCAEFGAALRGDGVGASVEASVGASVEASVGASVEAGVGASVEAGVGGTLRSEEATKRRESAASPPAVSPLPLEEEGRGEGAGIAPHEALPPAPQPSPLKGERAAKQIPGTDGAAGSGAAGAKKTTSGAEATPPFGTGSRKTGMGGFIGGIVVATVGGGGLAWWHERQSASSPGQEATAKSQTAPAASGAGTTATTTPKAEGAATAAPTTPPEKASGASEATAAPMAPAPARNIPTEFWFYYRFDPQPNWRQWIRSDDKLWLELYPNGNVTKHRVITDDTTHDGCRGTMVSPNDGTMEIFIPDIGCPNLPLTFRWNKGPWGLVEHVTLGKHPPSASATHDSGG